MKYVVNSYEPSSVQKNSRKKCPEICMISKQQNPENKKKVKCQTHETVNDQTENNTNFNKIYIPKGKKRRSSKFLFLFYILLINLLIKYIFSNII